MQLNVIYIAMCDVIVTITLQRGESVLHLASERGHVSVVGVLIGALANINLQDKVL